jgi:hypothetical protein
MVVLVPVPLSPIGFSVQEPLSGKPLSITLPVAESQLDCIIVPTKGAGGSKSGAFITRFAETEEVHAAALVTVKVYVPAGKPDIFVPIPVPVDVTAPGLRVNVQVPVAGKPFIATVVIGMAQVGCTIVPIMGASGLTAALTTTLVEVIEAQPNELVTLYV